MKYQIRSLGYDPESDELDLLINIEKPQPAEAVPVDAGVYLRRDFQNGQIVGAFIRGYQQFAREIAEGKRVPRSLAEQEGFADVFDAIIEWQREVGSLSSSLAARLGEWPPQEKLLQILVKTPVSVLLTKRERIS